MALINFGNDWISALRMEKSETDLLHEEQARLGLHQSERCESEMPHYDEIIDAGADPDLLVEFLHNTQFFLSEIYLSVARCNHIRASDLWCNRTNRLSLFVAQSKELWGKVENSDGEMKLQSNLTSHAYRREIAEAFLKLRPTRDPHIGDPSTATAETPLGNSIFCRGVLRHVVIKMEGFLQKLDATHGEYDAHERESRPFRTLEMKAGVICDIINWHIKSAYDFDARYRTSIIKSMINRTTKHEIRDGDQLGSSLHRRPLST